LSRLQHVLAICVRKDLLDVLKDNVCLFRGVHPREEVPLLVEVDEGSCLVVVGCEAMLQRLGVVVGATNQRLAGNLKR
jgi:hypothetical protein